MWSLIATIIGIVAKLFGIGKPDPEAQGEKLGKAEAAAADDQGELENIKKADDARKAVSDDPAAIASDPNNAGP